MISTVVVAVTALSLAVSVSVATWMLVRRDHIRTARPFALVMLVHAAWEAAHLGEALATTLEGKVLFDSLQYLPYAAAPVVYVGFALEFAGLRRQPRLLAALGVGSALLALPLLTEPLHGALHPDARLVGRPPVLTYAFSTLDAVLTIVVFGSFLASFVITVRRTAQEHRLYAVQSALVAVSLSIPAVGALLALGLGVTLDGDRDVTPVFFMLNALVAAWGLRRHQLLDLTPVARDAVIATLPDPLLVFDHRHRLVDTNQAALAFLGATDRDVTGRPADEVLERHRDLAALVEAGGGPVELCRVRDGGSGGLRWYEARLEALRGPGAATLGTILVLRDITARKLASARLENELAFSEERFRALFDQVTQLTGILDTDGNVLAANRASLEMIGKREDEIVGTPFVETPWWSEAGPRAQLEDAIQRAAAGEQVRFQTQHTASNGKVHHIDFSLTPVRDADGRVIQLIPEGRDVTQLHDEQHRAQMLAHQLEIARKLESLGRLAGGVAHDLNNLLMVMRIHAEEARGELPPGSPVHANVDGIVQAVDTTAQLTRQLLALSRDRASIVETIDVGASLRAGTRLLQRLLREDIQLRVDVPAGLGKIHADASQVQQAVLNLALNGQDAMPEGGELHIAVANVTLDVVAAAQIAGGRPGEHVCVEVADSGLGMDEATLARVFEPFFTTKAPGKGTGLGLPVVQDAVIGAGGFIAVESAPGRGTRFRLYFPRVVEATPAAVAAAAAAAAPGATTAPATAPSPDGATIAVIEDQDTLRQLIARRLQRLGYQPITFATPRELLERAETMAQSPALVLTDVVMPGMNGLELARALTQRWPALRVLFMSGYTGDVPAIQVAAVRDHLLHKPFSPEELGERVRRAIAAPPWSQGA